MNIAVAAGKTRRMQLREATRAAHQTLDDLIGSWPDLSDYRRYLAGQRRFRAAIEDIDPAAAGLAWSITPLSAALAEDCADLGVRTQPTSGAPLRPRGASEALGVCYVVEGSALGARLLHARAAELGLGDGFAARHLANQASSTRWRAFVALLEETEPFDFGAAAAAANAAFALAAHAFGSVGDV